jgi:hypothetical protein
VLKALDDREYSPSTGAAYPRNRWYLDLLRDPGDIDERDDDDDEDDDDDVGKADHHASVVADLLVESGRFTDRPSALHHLFHKPAGQALLARMKKKDEPMTSTSTHAESLRDVVKQYGIVALAKSMVKDEKSYGLDEPSFTALATEAAQRLYPNDRPDSAFSKLFESEESVRRACNFIKVQAHRSSGMTTIYEMPDPPRGAAATAYTKSDPAPGADSAYAELQAKAAEYRKAHPGLSEAQAFERVYSDRSNIELAKRERQESALR